MILYGHSLGGGSVVMLAGELKEIGVPVLLTIQVDSVGRKDRIIPSNVARAINFYQHDGNLFVREAQFSCVQQCFGVARRSTFKWDRLKFENDGKTERLAVELRR